MCNQGTTDLYEELTCSVRSHCSGTSVLSCKSSLKFVIAGDLLCSGNALAPFASSHCFTLKDFQTLAPNISLVEYISICINRIMYKFRKIHVHWRVKDNENPRDASNENDRRATIDNCNQGD